MPPKYECDCCKGHGSGRPSASAGPKHRRAVELHMAKLAGGFDNVLHSESPGGEPVSIYIAGPTKKRPCCVLLTAGLSNHPMTVPEGIGDECSLAELSICLPPDWRFTRKAFRKGWWWWPIRDLLDLARYPQGEGSWLWYHHVVGDGEPLAPNLPFTNRLLHPSLVMPEEFWQIPISKEKSIWVLSLYPLHPDEYEVWVDSGAHALIDLLEEGGVTDLFDPNRKSVVA